MNETERIIDQLNRAFEGSAWHGPSITEIVKDVDPAMALAKPLEGVHSIWEILLHVIVWIRIGRMRVDGELKVQHVDPKDDWPPIDDSSAEAWKRSLDTLRKEHELLVGSCARLTDAALSATVPGGDYTNYVLLHGVVQHTLYHAGQMAMLRMSLMKKLNKLPADRI